MRTVLLTFFLLGAVPSLLNAEEMKMPLVRTALQKSHLNILLEPEVVPVLVEKGKPKSVIVKARGIFKKVDFSKRPGDAGFVYGWERYRPYEFLLIDGIDVAETGSGCVLFHKKIGVGQRGLWVWYVGVEKVRIKHRHKGKYMWLKKYTVDPRQAEVYYKTQKRK